MSESLRTDTQIKIGALWLEVHRMSHDPDITPEFREALTNSARLLHQADQALSVRPVVPWEPVAGKPEVFFPGEVGQ